LTTIALVVIIGSLMTTMRQTGWIRLLCCSVSLAVMLAAAQPAFACQCVTTFSGQPACQARWTHSAVFVGRVVRIEPSSRPIDIGPGMRPFVAQERRVHFVVTEAFSGVTAREVDITTGVGDGDCGYAFTLDQEYLVYAYKEADGGLGTGTCSPTRKVGDAARDLAFLRSIPTNPGRDGRIVGLVLADLGPDGKQQPFPGASITVEGQGLVRVATSGADGAYEIRVPTGRYRVRAEVDPDRYTAPQQNEIELKDTRGCAVADFTVRLNGHLRVRVVSSDGKPVPGLTLKLEPIENDATGRAAEGHTDPDGRLNLDHVAPGRYRLAFYGRPNANPPFVSPPIFLPDLLDALQARVIKVGPSETIDVGDFVSPADVSFVVLNGVVRDALGAAVAGAHVYLFTDSAQSHLFGMDFVTDADGRFSLAAIDGVSYKIVAEFFVGRKPATGEAHVIAAHDLPAIVLTAVVR
jgi:Carboxypeptidase regulatory-like domain